ncbi:hypothetical protein S40288_09934 [Stachybotrys chartarum IBT 40288]|nr:hypothetical protein S40288_09934 [Stachybotrys chartarum IBT 40288]
MPSKPVLIIGGGISGLCVARLLVQRGIHCIIFEQSVMEKSQGYAITVRDWAFKPLLEELGGVTVDAFQNAVAVDRAFGGSGWVDLTFRNNETGKALFNPEPPKGGNQGALFRANRSALRDWLSDGLDVRYEHKLEGVRGTPGHVTAVFRSGLEIAGSILIGADGVNSSVRRALLPNASAEVLPVVLFHGKRVMTVEAWRELWTNHIGASTVAAGVGDNFNTFITVANGTNSGSIYLDWTYSRARAGEDDALWMPTRSEIMKVPQHLLKEIRSKDLVPPFSILVDADAIKKDKVYNWRIWALQVSREDLDRVSERGVVLIGDAVHAMPIFGGEGGNHAILDSVELFKIISARWTETLIAGDVRTVIQDFYNGAYQRGQDAVKRCAQRFSQFHQPIEKWEKVAETATRNGNRV